MAFGDFVNSIHASVAATTSHLQSLNWATTAGDTLFAVVRRGGTSLGTTTVQVSYDSGSTYTQTMTLDKNILIASAGALSLFRVSNITGAPINQTVIKTTFDVGQTMRYVYAEYSGNFVADQQNSKDDGSTTAIDSNPITTAAAAAILGCAAGGNNASAAGTQTSPITGGTSGVLAWTNRDELDIVNVGATNMVAILLDDGGGTTAAGTYSLVATQAHADNVGAIIASYTDANAPLTTVSAPRFRSLQQAVNRASTY